MSVCLGCAGMSSRERLTWAVSDYNEALRWGNLRAAEPFVPTDQAKAFVKRHKEDRGNLEINDYEIDSVVMEDKSHAVVRVTFVWSRRSEGLVRQTTVLQRWERHDREWRMVSEKFGEGAPLVWLQP